MVVHHPATAGPVLLVEGNLTAALHGKNATAGSLEGHELAPAVDRLLDSVADWGRVLMPEKEQLRLTRVDPSRTVRVPAGSAPAVVEGFARAFGPWAGGRRSAVLTRGAGLTARLQHSKSRSLTVYDKGAEAGGKGQVVPDEGLVRFEARVRPPKVQAWKELELTMADVREGGPAADAAKMELDQVEQLLGQISAHEVEGIARQLRAGGASPQAAVRLAGVLQYVDAMGWAAVPAAFEIPERTVERWRLDARRYIAAAGGAEGFLTREARNLADLLGADYTATEAALRNAWEVE